MRRLTVAFSLCVAVSAQEKAPALQPAAAERLFDGATLNGWRGDPAVWSVRDGCIVGSTEASKIAANTFLVLDARQPGDFVFSAMVRLQGDNNSGVQYRSRELNGGTFRVGGYQCDLHGKPEYLAQLYDEQGAGIVAGHGQFVLWRDGGRSVLGTLSKPRDVDVAAWHQLQIVACGDLVWHLLDGRVVTAVKDERKDAPRRGVIALQVHTGAPMTVSWKDLTLCEYPSAEVMQQHIALPAAMRSLLKQQQGKAVAKKGLVPQWLWDAEAGADEELFFRRAFTLEKVPSSARLTVSCDNHCRCYVNGEKVGTGDEWQSPSSFDVQKTLRVGENVIAVHGWNEGGPAALAARLCWQVDGADRELVSDATWTCCSDDPDGWNAPGFQGKGFAPVRVLAAMGAKGAPWSDVHAEDALGSAVDADAPQVAVLETGLEWPGHSGEPPEVQRLLSVPRSLGSWVSLGADPKGRLYASDQRSGLYRITPATGLGELSQVERVNVDLGGCHGLLWFRDALYAVVNGKESGLYRLTDTNNDDVLDRVELLRALEGEGEHGPHSVVVAPDGVNLLVVCGNQTKLPELAASRVQTNWREDRLLPRLDDPNRYWEGFSPPGGWVCQVDPDGKRWELICCGFRNAYDIVVLPNGLVVAYDSDMEWDMGLPWYRPTRLLAVQSGVDYGWRIGSAKWPADYPESPPSLRDIGPGSPTGMAYWRDMMGGMLALDWTFGTVYRNGAPWLIGAPFPVADVAVVADPAGRQTGYFVTGGRGLPSTLYRVPLPQMQDDETEQRRAALLWGAPVAWPATETRSAAEVLATLEARPVQGDAVKRVLIVAGEEPRPGARILSERVTARIALERLPVAEYRSTVLAVDPAQPSRSLTGLLALVRQGAPPDLQPVLEALGKLPFGPLSPEDRIAWLRVHALALLRLGPATDAQRTLVAARMLPLFPANDERIDADLAELLAFVDASGFLDKAVPLLTPPRPSPVPEWAKVGKQSDVYGSQYAGVIDAMSRAMPPIGQLAIANALRTVKHGWTLEQRRTFFAFLALARKQKGGSSYDGYLLKMIDAGWATCTEAEQRELAELVGKARADAPKFRSTPPKGPGRDWQTSDIDMLTRAGSEKRNLRAGHNLFHASGCASCHYFAGEGGNYGPDLTSLGNKFGPRDVLESILEPSLVVSDQYSGSVLTKKDGSTLFGSVKKTHHGDSDVYEVVPATAEAKLVRVSVADVLKVEPSKLSPMPKDLVDRLSADELRDLLAFLLSRGQESGNGK
jgi:putative heme-binding domain-containing protein